MKVSYAWLQRHIKETLPNPEEIREKLTMQSFEVGGFSRVGEDTVFDMDILPNRAHDALSHRGIAKEIALLFGLSFIKEKKISLPKEEGISVAIENKEDCSRYTATLVENISIGESPVWLKTFLSSIGQKSINTAVDAGNFVMFDMGQPLHVFDADKIKGGIVVRRAKTGEKLTTLDNKDIALNETMLIIADEEGPLALAGIKGGKRAEVDVKTKRILIEAANFSGPVVRKTSRTLPLFTDASKRFENVITDAFAKEGAEKLSALLTELCGGKVASHTDAHPRKQKNLFVGASVSEINAILGTNYTEKDIEETLQKLEFPFEKISNIRERLLEEIKKQLGIPYDWSDSMRYDPPDFFDCSSLCTYVYSRVGISIPITSVDQHVFGTPIEKEELLPGDLITSNTGIGKIHHETSIFMKGTSVSEGIDHVGMWIGDGKVIHSTKSKGGTVEEELSNAGQFQNKIWFRRILDNEEPRFVVTVPLERIDIEQTEDLVEEIGRVLSYARLPEAPLQEKFSPLVHQIMYWENKIREILLTLGFSEISTYTFRNKGDQELENPPAEGKEFLRINISDGLREGIVSNMYYKEFLGMKQIKLFEVGNIFREKDKQEYHFGIALEKKKGGLSLESVLKDLEEKIGHFDVTIETKDGIETGEFNLGALSEKEIPSSYENLFSPKSNNGGYKILSPYPFVLRDVAVFIPEGEGEKEAEDIILSEGGDLLIRHALFDTYTKEFPEGKKTSYAFNLVFQSYEKTLSDAEVNEIMDRIYSKMKKRSGWEIR